MNGEKLIKIIEAIAKKIHENKQLLTDLDAAIGDGDHGINLDRGFKAVVEKLPTVADKDLGTILKTIGMSLVSSVGGASGPLFGTAFMKAGMVTVGKEELTNEDIIKVFEAAIEGIQMRGKAVKGEKTMLDALIPAVDALKEKIAQDADIKDALIAAEKVAKEGVEYTKTIIATKGRASYLGERSIGHQDAGATSIACIFEAINESIK